MRSFTAITGKLLVLLTTEAGATARDLLAAARIPVLSSGKTDYPAVSLLLTAPKSVLEDAD